ncbi:type IV secretion system DNA-binding domain-containing protein [Dactylosporangium sp. NPDC049525]|uniref:type IV secretory system conjugative DNA transfer family protein n=1 Tax=Dactylosporangium sp. NPDC049525 TaxID=3154730 RepID=UPI003416C2DA
MSAYIVFEDSTPPPPPAPALTGPSAWLLDTVAAVTSWTAQHPWSAGAVAAAGGLLAAGGYLGRAVLTRRRQQAMARHAQVVVISPPPEVDPAGAAVFWTTIAEVLRTGWQRRLRHGRHHIAVEYRWGGRALTIAVWLPGSVHVGPVRAAILGAWPGAGVTVLDADPPLPADAAAVGGALTPAMPAWFPLQTDHDNDPLRTLIAAASNLHTAERACVQILARPASGRQLQRLRAGVQALRSGTPAPGGVLDPERWMRAGLDLLLEVLVVLSPGRGRAGRSSGRPGPVTGGDPQRDRDVRAAVDKLTGPQWEVAVRYGVARTHRAGGRADARIGGRGDGRGGGRGRSRGGDAAGMLPRLAAVADGVVAAFGVYTGRNRLRRLALPQPAAVLAARVLRRGFLLSTTELAAIAALPYDIAVPGLDRARATPRPAPVSVPSGGRGTKMLGKADVGGHAVAVNVADSRQHLHVLGSTGSGKSTLLLNMILDDIHARRGTIVIDPKGDLVIDLLDRIPARFADRLVIIDPDQPSGTILNPLAGDDHDLVVDNIVSIFGRIFAKHWGPRIDDTLRVACLTLMRKANATLTLIPPLLNDRQFRHAFTQDLDDPEGLRGYWEWFESTPPPLRAQVIGPVLSRLRAFLLRDFVRRTLGAPQSTFDMRRVLDGGILLARLPKGQIGEETARLMGSFIVASAWQAATGRVRLPEQQRRDAAAYIDEAHNFLNLPGSVGDMLAEARGYHFGLVLAHQNLTQMPRDTQLAISANARNKIFFSCAPEDAHQLARHTLPELNEHDLSHMDAYRAACRLVVDGRETAAFTLRTNPARAVVGEATAVRQVAAAAVGTHQRTLDGGSRRHRGQSPADRDTSNSSNSSNSSKSAGRAGIAQLAGVGAHDEPVPQEHDRPST